MDFWHAVMYAGAGPALSLGGFRLGELRMKDRMLDFPEFFAAYLRDGDARFLPDTDGPAALVGELARAMEEEL